MQLVDLAALVDRELARLPLPSAPPTLLPRVMAAVRGWSMRPWYQRAWFTWPPAWQLASVVVLAMLVSVMALLVPDAQAAARDLTGSIMARLGLATKVPGLVQQLGATRTALEVVWRSLLQPVATHAAALVVLMFLASVTIASALSRVAARRTVS